MIRFLKALILLPVAILIVLLAVANRAPVTLSLDPFSQDAPEFATQLPLFAVIFAAVMLGVVIGGVGELARAGQDTASPAATQARDAPAALRDRAPEGAERAGHDPAGNGSVLPEPRLLREGFQDPAMRVVTSAEIDRVLTFPALIEALAEAFCGDMVAPVRHHHEIERDGAHGTLLLMPAWTGPAIAGRLSRREDRLGLSRRTAPEACPA